MISVLFSYKSVVKENRLVRKLEKFNHAGSLVVGVSVWNVGYSELISDFLLPIVLVFLQPILLVLFLAL